jgi:hypothetical protein
MVIEIAIFSSHSAEKSDWFMSAQSCATQFFPIAIHHDVGDLRCPVDVVDLELQQVRRVLGEETLREIEGDEAVRRVELVEAERVDPTTRARRVRGIMPIGESVPCGVSNETESPIASGCPGVPNCTARVLTEQNARRLVL